MNEPPQNEPEARELTDLLIAISVRGNYKNSQKSNHVSFFHELS